jgi:hypothetical protein
MTLSSCALKGKSSARSDGSRQTVFARHEAIKKIRGQECVARTYTAVTLVVSGHNHWHKEII